MPLQKIYIFGSFNNWRKFDKKYLLSSIDLHYGISLYLKEDNHKYNFIVNGREQLDFNNSNIGVKHDGEKCSIIKVRYNPIFKRLKHLYKPRITRNKVQFFYYNKKPIKEVRIVGSFRGWYAYKKFHLLKKNLWTLTLQLKPGKHQYKYIVDGMWTCPMFAHDYTQDGFGYNAGIVEIK